jgi:membrane associated rhomboid family serine protease/Tfp pilus assembly protein PilF
MDWLRAKTLPKMPAPPVTRTPVIICVKMANCVQCGRQLAAFTFGKHRKLCQWCVQHEAAQRGEDSSIQRVETAPWKQQQAGSMVVTQAIFGLNVVVFLAMVFSGVSPLEPTSQDLVRWGANFGPYTIGGQWWRLLSCVFVHIGIMHIALNMWCLWGLGRLAESIYDRWTFGAVYLITGVSASVASLAWNPVGVSAGASGAIFGIAGALISSFYLGEFPLPKSVTSSLLKSVLKFAGYNLVLGAMLGHTDNAAHVGGLVSGLVMGALISRVAPRREDVMRRIAVLLVGALLALGGTMWLHRSHAYLYHGQNGYALLSEGKTDDAIAELQKSVRMRPNFAATHLALARAYLAKHDFEDAAAEMRRVIALNPRSEEGYYQLGLIYLEQKNPAKAEETFTQLLKIDPRSADGHAGLADAFADEHRNAEALKEYKQVAALDSSYQGVNYNMGVMQARLKLYDDAIASLLKQRQVGDDGDNENLLADVYEADGMKSEAADARQKAQKVQSSPQPSANQ